MTMQNREHGKFKAAFRCTDLYKQYAEQMPDKAIFQWENGQFAISVIQACYQMWQHPILVSNNPRCVRLRELKNLNGWTVKTIAELTGSKESTVCVWLTQNTKRPIPKDKLRMLEDEHSKINRRSDGEYFF